MKSDGSNCKIDSYFSIKKRDNLDLVYILDEFWSCGAKVDNKEHKDYETPLILSDKFISEYDLWMM